MENLDNIRFMLNNKSPDLTSIKSEIASLINNDNFKLREVQLEALAIICKYGVLLGNIGVGHGKTFISLLARLVTRSKRCLLFVPNDLIPQLTLEDIPFLEGVLGTSLDWCTIDGVEKTMRVEMMDKHSLTIIPYSLLSTDDTYEVLEASYADLIIFDECAMIKNKKSARTGRIISYWDRNPHINLVFLSGTIAKNSLFDFHHLITRGLHRWSTLPYSWHDVNQIQETTAYDNEQSSSVCFPLVKIKPELNLGDGWVDVVGARKFVRTLLKSSPCVIMTENQAVTCSLKVNHIDDVKLPPSLLNMIKEVDETWTSPNGDLIEDHIVKYQICSQLADGFWYRLFWPVGTPQWAIDLHKMKREVDSAIKSFILVRHRDKLDTPFLVYGALARRDERVREFQGLYDSYIKFKSGFPDCDKYKRDRETIWINKDKEKIALKWCKHRKQGIIWYEHQATGDSLFETLKNEGIDVIQCIAACPLEDLKQNKIQLMSFSHIKGKNLQHQFENLLYNMSESAADLEQLMGRTPREGQKSDYVQYDFVISSPQDRDHFRKLILQAYWSQDSFGEQKILIADFSKPEYIHGIRGNTTVKVKNFGDIFRQKTCNL